VDSAIIVAFVVVMASIIAFTDASLPPRIVLAKVSSFDINALNSKIEVTTEAYCADLNSSVN